jgi:hypothetical protein
LDLGETRLSTVLDSKHGPGAAKRLLETCQRISDDRMQFEENGALLKLLVQHLENSAHQGDSKRKCPDE